MGLPRRIKLSNQKTAPKCEADRAEKCRLENGSNTIACNDCVDDDPDLLRFICCKVARDGSAHLLVASGHTATFGFSVIFVMGFNTASWSQRCFRFHLDISGGKPLSAADCHIYFCRIHLSLDAQPENNQAVRAGSTICRIVFNVHGGRHDCRSTDGPGKLAAGRVPRPRKDRISF